tara:strand:+ start:1704 stop:2789 length:1086 start_codon:yes stop_codon:yes gene_type:complete
MPIERKLAAIVFIDIVDYSTLMHENEEQAFHLLSLQKDVVYPIITKYNGSIIKEMGDGLLLSFNSAIEAVQCSLQIQAKIEFIENLNYRVGIHLGDVIIEKNDAFGDGVNIASRIQHIAEPGQVCISKSIFEAIQNHPKIKSFSLGKKKLKGIKENIELFIVSNNKEDAQAKIPNMQAPSNSYIRKNLKSKFLGFILTILVVISSITLFYKNSPNSNDITIAILPFSNTKDDKEFAWLSQQFSIDLTERVSKIDYLTVKDFSIVKKIFDSVQIQESNVFDIGLAQKVGEKIKSKYVIYGTYLIIKEQVRITCFINNVEQNKIIKSYKETYDISEIMLVLNNFPEKVEALINSCNLNNKNND